MDDAAIYQASARNSKGIVSCSGVLEVGTMSEYKIHQRFFSKLKQKADLKRKELEQSYCQEKENILKEQLSSSQNSVRWNDGLVHNSSSVQVGKDNEAKKKEEREEQPETLNENLNRLSVKVNRYLMRSESQDDDRQHMSSDVGQKNGNQQLIHGSERATPGGPTVSTKGKASRNTLSIPNGFDEDFTSHSRQGTGQGKDTHEERSLAQILGESLQLQFSEELQKTTLQSQEITSTKASTIKPRKRENEGKDTEGEKKNAEGRHPEWDNCRKGEQTKVPKEKEENFTQPKPENRAVAVSEANTPVYTEAENRHKSALSSVFHSLKDIFFGKSKKSPEITDSFKKVSDINAEKETLAGSTEAHFHLPQTQPQPYVSIPDQQNQTASLCTPLSQESPSSNITSELKDLKLDTHIHGFTDNNIKDISQASKTHLGSVEEKKEADPDILQKNACLTICEVSLFLLLLTLIFLSITGMHSRTHLKCNKISPIKIFVLCLLIAKDF